MIWIFWFFGCELGCNCFGIVDIMCCYVYIYGSLDVVEMGIFGLYGCICMCNLDIVELFDCVFCYSEVEIIED